MTNKVLTRRLIVSFFLALPCAAAAAFGQAAMIPELVIQTGHTNTINALAFTPDGKSILSASDDGSIRVWDLLSGKETRAFHRFCYGYTSLAISSDGKMAVSGEDTGVVVLWDIATGLPIREFKLEAFRGFANNVFSLVFSPDDKCILSGSRDATIQLWDIAAGKRIRTFVGHALTEDPWSGVVYALAFSPDGRYFASGSADTTIKLWDVESPQALRSFAGPSKAVKSVKFSPDGKRLLSGADDGTMKLWDVASGLELRDFRGSSPVDISPDGELAISRGERNSLKLWDLGSGTSIRTFTGRAALSGSSYLAHGDSVVFSPDGKFAAVAYDDNSIVVWNLDSGQEAKRLLGQTSRVTAIAYSKDGRYALEASQIPPFAGVLYLWDIAQGRVLRSFLGHESSITSVCFSPDSKYALTGSLDDTAILWDLGSGEAIRTFSGHTEGLTRKFGHEARSSAINSVCFSPDGKYAATGASDATVKLWDIASGTAIRTFSGHAYCVNSIDISPDGRFLVSGADDNTMRLWDLASGKEMWIGQGFEDSVIHVSFSPDGKQIRTDCRGKQLWDTATGRLIKKLDIFGAASFSPDGSCIVSGGVPGMGPEDQGAIWNVETGKIVRFFKAASHVTGFRDAVFSPDGKCVLSMGSGGVSDPRIALWDAATGKIIYNALANPAGTEWLLYNDEGYWDASPDGGSLVAMVRGTEAWNIDQFALRSNRPDKILENLPGAGRESIDEYYAQYWKRLSRLGLEEKDLSADFRVPSARIMDSKQAGKYVDLELAFAANGKPLARYQVYANDVPLHGALGKPLSGDGQSVHERVELTRGNNKIEVSCMDAGGAESFRASESASWSGEAEANLYYLAFGVSEYEDPKIGDLRYAAKDCRDLEAVFKAMEGKAYGRVFTAVYTDAQVTRKAIGGAKDFLSAAKPDDTFVLFISGHGIQVGKAPSPQSGGVKGLSVAGPDPRVAVPLGRTYYYVTADCRLADIPGTAASFEMVEDLLQGIAPRQKLFLMDTCESGEAEESGPRLSAAGTVKGINARTLSLENTRGLSVASATVTKVGSRGERWIYNDLVRRSGAIVFSSCRGNEASLEADQWQQGAFTHSILNAFRERAADGDGNGTITVDELRAFVIAEVPKLVQAVDPSAQQHPTVDRDNIYAKFGF